jgi:hypothetical protein
MSLPWYQKPISWLISLAIYDISRGSSQLTVLNAQNFRTYYSNNELKPIRWYDRIVQWLMTSNDNYLGDNATYAINNGVHWWDIGAVIVNVLINLYRKMIRWMGYDKVWVSEQAMIEDTELWAPTLFDDFEVPIQPDQILTPSGIETFLMTIPPLELMVQDGINWSIDTYFLDNYELQDDAASLGCRVEFTENSGSFKLRRMTYQQLEVNLTVENKVAYRAFYIGVLNWITVTVHAYNVHTRISVGMTRANREFLSLDHTLRLVLMPNELQTLLIVAKASRALTAPNGILDVINCFTRDGTKAFINDFNRRVHTPDIMPAFILNKSSEVPTIKALSDWHTLIHEFATDIVSIMWSSDNDIDADTVNWYSACQQYMNGDTNVAATKERVAEMITAIYFNEIRHKLLSNMYITWFGYYIYTWQRISSLANNASHSTLLEKAQFIITAITTKLESLNMNVDMSELLGDNHDVLKLRWRKFYMDMDSRITPSALLKPNEISASTAV